MSDRDRPEWQIAFTLAAGYDEQDAIELYEQIEGSPCVSGAALTAADAVQAPSEATHRPKVPEVARKYDGEHGLVVEFEDEKP